MQPFKRITLLFAVLAVASSCGDFEADRLTAPEGPADLTVGPAIKVMSQNLYLGVDMGTLLAGDVGTAMSQLGYTTALDAAQPTLGPRRLYDIAEQIAAEEPHLVGLQEVMTYIIGLPGQPPTTLSFQAVIDGVLTYLHASQRTDHTWSWVVNPTLELPPLPIPIGPGLTMTVEYKEADAILIRDDVTLIGDAVIDTFAAYAYFDVFGATFPDYRGWEAVPVEVDGQELVFVNTHLEVQAYGGVQVAQAAELIGFMKAQDVPVVAVGDFNSAANHDAPEDQYSGSYSLFREAGYADIWLREPHSVEGLTCCQAGDLRNPVSELHSRLDLVLVDWGPVGFSGQSELHVVGEESGDRIAFTAVTIFGAGPFPLTLWPADHAGVVATLWPAAGRVN